MTALMVKQHTQKLMEVLGQVVSAHILNQKFPLHLHHDLSEQGNRLFSIKLVSVCSTCKRREQGGMLCMPSIHWTNFIYCIVSGIR